jgi:hypothetical protein
VVEENENLKIELMEAHEEIANLRKQLLNIGFSPKDLKRQVTDQERAMIPGEQ